MKKKLIAWLLVICMAISLLPAAALADTAATSGKCGDNVTWTLDDSGTLTISGEGSMADYSWSENSYGVLVTTAPWGEYYDTIKSVVIEAGVTSVGEYAFSYCSSLESVTIPNSVTSIGECAFLDCSSLESVTIGNSVTSIGNSAFYECSKIIDVYYTGDVSSWLDISFGNSNSNPCRSGTNLYFNGELVTDVVIPNSITSIGDYVFCGCSSLTSVTIPDSVTSIGDDAFYDCSNLNDIYYSGTISEWKVISLGSSSAAFSYAKVRCADGEINGFGTCGENIKWLLDGSGTLTISGTGAMYNYSSTRVGIIYVNDAPWVKLYKSIESVVIKAGVTNIGEDAFYSCSSLTSITIPDSVTNIGRSAFYGCSSLTSITIPDSVTSIGDYVFRGCSSLTSVTIGNGVTSIDNGMFRDCCSLTSVTIGDGVTSIGDWAFEGCSKIKDVYYTGDVSSWLDISFGGLDSNPCQSGANLYFNGELVTDVVIPNSVTKIDNYVFEGCSSLTSVTIPDSVTSIGWYAFRGCSSLTSVTMGNGVTRIGSYAFYGCSSLTSVTIPDSVTRIDNDAFRDCSSLTSVTIPASVTSIGDYAFLWCNNLKDVAFGGTKEAWNAIGYTFSGVRMHYNCASLEGHYVPMEVKESSCTSTGYTKYSCTCGFEYIEEIPENHNFVYSKTVAPTCGEHGYDLLVCSKCGGEKKEYHDDELLEHSYQATVVEPTCLNGGYTLHKCSVCGESYKDELVQPLGHSEVSAEAKAPTCTESGHTAGTCCSRCGKTMSGMEEVAALGHSYKNGICTRCGAKDPNYIAAPTLKITTSSGKPKISWNAVDGATKYWVYRSTDGKNFKYYDKTTKTSYTNSSTTIGTTYYYKVKAVKVVDGQNVVSDFSNTRYIKCALAAPTLKITTSSGKPKIYWDAVDGATKYWIYRSTDGVNFKYYDSTTKTSYTNNSTSIGTTYYYKVKAVKVVNGENFPSVESVVKSIKCTPAAPSLSISRVNGKPKLSWNAVSGATKYWIYRSTDGVNFKYYDSTTKTNYTNNSTSVGTKYYYRVKAVTVVNGKNVASENSNTKSLLVSTAAPSAKITTSNGKPKISWNAVSGATKYWIYRSTDGVNFSYWDSTTRTSYTNTGAKKNTKYYYRVKAVKVVNGKNIASAYSGTVSIKATK